MIRTRQLNFFGEFNVTGVGRHIENAYFATLRHRPQGMVVEYVNQARPEVVRAAAETFRERSSATLYFWRYGEDVLRALPGSRVLWWFFESDRLADAWVEQALRFDELWAPSAWARDVLLAHGFEARCLRVVPSGVNTKIFRPAPIAHENFVFLLVGKYEKRKSIDETVEAFESEFPRDRYAGMELWLKADFPLFPDRIMGLVRRVAHDPRIRVISGSYSDVEMAELYHRADAFVFPTKAEGFGLPCLEALSCGLPVITTEVSAQSEFLDPIRGLYAAVDYDMAPIVDEDYAWFYGREYGSTNFGNWAIPSLASLRAAMRGVYEDFPAWRARGLRAAESIHEKFCWDAVGRQVAAAANDACRGTEA